MGYKAYITYQGTVEVDMEADSREEADIKADTEAVKEAGKYILDHLQIYNVEVEEAE